MSGTINPHLMYNLAYLFRYANVPRIHNESVAEHSFFVVVEVIKLSEKYKFNIERAVCIAACHDFAESEIDDIKWDVQQRFPDIKTAIRNAEKEVINSYPDFVKNAINEYNGWKTDEAKVVHLADAIQCRTYANNEISLGNRGYMLQVKHSAEKRMERLASELEHILIGDENE